jgi:hypothetical protein
MHGHPNIKLPDLRLLTNTDIDVNGIPYNLTFLCTIQSVSRLYGITAGGDFPGLCDEKSSYKHVFDFGRLRSYDRFLIPVHTLV